MGGREGVGGGGGEGESIQRKRKQRLPKVNQVDTRKSQRESRTFRRVLLVRMIRVSGKRFSVFPRLLAATECLSTTEPSELMYTVKKEWRISVLFVSPSSSSPPPSPRLPLSPLLSLSVSVCLQKSWQLFFFQCESIYCSISSLQKALIIHMKYL